MNIYRGRPNEKGNDKYDSYRYYVCGIKINGEDYTAKVVIGVKDGSIKTKSI